MKAPSSNCLMIGGGVVVVLFAVVMGTIQVIFEVSVEGALKLKDGKPIMDAFTVPPIPIFMNFMFFNVTNPRDAQFYGKKPKLVEVGPYVYEEHREKFSKDFLDDGDDIQYRQNKYYKFREDKSNGLKETDVITTVNVIMPMLAALTYNNDNIKYLWPEIERTMNIFNTFTVDETLFGGWELPEFNFNFSQSGISAFENITYSGTLHEIMQQLGVPESDIPKPIVDNKIGYFSMMNDTDDGVWRVSTGKADMSEYLEVLQYQNKTELSFWNDPYCDMINGTDGTQFPPFRIDEDTTVRIFVPELCRSLYLDYEREVTYQGVDGLRYIPPEIMLAMPPLNPDNACFCASLGCLGSSILELTPCLGIPVIMSTPHFYQGDGVELSKYEGLEPTKELHETYLDIETTFGVPLRAHKRIQINVPLRKFGSLTSFLNFEENYTFPVFWADEWAEIEESNGKTLNLGLSIPTIVYGVGGALVVIGAIMLLFGIKKHFGGRSTV